jgi:hypothetical protein
MAEGWRVTSQRETTIMFDGSFTKAIEVYFRTDDGTTGSVTIPLAQYGPDAVTEAITERVATIEAVAQL